MTRSHSPARTILPLAQDLDRFDLNLLRAFDALIVTRGVSNAARRLGLSQPATSAALNRLRAAFGDPLLVRAGNRMLPTPLANELHQRIARILEDLSLALGAVSRFDPNSTRRRFRIGATDYTAQVVLPKVAATLRIEAPHSTLEIFPSDVGGGSSLITRELDLLIADRWQLREERSLDLLFAETFVSMAHCDHPRLPPVVDLDAFVAEDHALVSWNGTADGSVDAALRKLGRNRRVALTLPYFLAAANLVAHTDLIITVPRRIADGCAHDRRLRRFEPPLKLQGFDVVLATHSGDSADAPIAWLRGLVRQVA